MMLTGSYPVIKPSGYHLLCTAVFVHSFLDTAGFLYTVLIWIAIFVSVHILFFLTFKPDWRIRTRSNLV